MKLLNIDIGRMVSVTCMSLLFAQASHAEWVNLGTRTFSRLCPAWVGGDREYAGHGPEVTAQASLSTANAGTELYINIDMHQIETRSDWSEAQLSRPFLVYRAPAGRRITSIFNSDVSSIFYVDTNHSPDRHFPTDNLVQEFRINGDTSGNDIGNCTADDAYVSVFTKPLWVFIE